MDNKLDQTDIKIDVKGEQIIISIYPHAMRSDYDDLQGRPAVIQLPLSLPQAELFYKTFSESLEILKENVKMDNPN